VAVIARPTGIERRSFEGRGQLGVSPCAGLAMPQSPVRAAGVPGGQHMARQGVGDPVGGVDVEVVGAESVDPVGLHVVAVLAGDSGRPGRVRGGRSRPGRSARR
jgi:hypothetical protein